MTNLAPSLRMLPEHMRQFFWDNADRFAVLRGDARGVLQEPIRVSVGDPPYLCTYAKSHRAVFLRNLEAGHWADLCLAILPSRGGGPPETLYWTRNHDLAREAICALLLRGDEMWKERARAEDRSREPISVGRRDVVREAAEALANPKLSVNAPAYTVAVDSVVLPPDARLAQMMYEARCDAARDPAAPPWSHLDVGQQHHWIEAAKRLRAALLRPKASGCLTEADARRMADRVLAAPKVGSVRLATGARALIEAWAGSEWIPLRALSINYQDAGPYRARPQIMATFEHEGGESRIERITSTAEQGGDDNPWGGLR